MLEIPLTIGSRVEKAVVRVYTPAKFDLLLGNDITKKFQIIRVINNDIHSYLNTLE